VPVVGTASDEGGLAVDIYAAVRKGGRLTTIEFYETIDHGGQIHRMTTPTDWDAEVPKDAALWAATAGVLTGLTGQYWVGWVASGKIVAQALVQEHPISVDLVGGETLIARPLMLADGTLHQFTWRPAPKGGRALWRHIFHGEQHQPGTVESAALAEIDGVPAGSIAVPVPGVSIPTPQSHRLPGGGMRVVLGWIDGTSGGARMSLAIIEGNQVETWSSTPLVDVTPLPRQRPGLYVGVANGTFELAAMGERAAPQPEVVCLRMLVRPEEPGPPQVLVAPFTSGPSTIVAAAAEYSKNWERKDPMLFALSSDGVLLRKSSAIASTSVVRRGVPPSYVFPVFTTGMGLYEVFDVKDGEVVVRSFGETP
jgi:hypothetical protein